MENLIYKCTCLANGKVYIGLTTKGLAHRISNHVRTSKCTNRNNMFYNAIKKHGKENFAWDVLEYCDEGELEKREIFWIRYFDSYHNGYNSTTGGELKKEYSTVSKLKMSMGRKGQIPWNTGLKLGPLSELQKEKLRILAKINSNKNRMNQKTRKTIRCKETGEVFNSIKECCNKMKLNKLSVSRNLRGIYHSAGGYWNQGFHFEQVEQSSGGYNS
jgi:group I intron endonuclease